MEEHSFKGAKTARYFTHGNDITRSEQVWFVLHGYGQLANYFLKNFEQLDPDKHFVVSAEGFHRFYLEGFSGRVGASWMTKESRLTDIEDYVNFLDSLFNSFNIPEEAEVNLLGFSQGVATALRWLALGEANPFHRLILWAGSFPPDLPPEGAKRVLSIPKVHCVVGDDDPFIKKDQLKKTKLHLDTMGIKPSWFRYSGDHRIPKQALEKLMSKSDF